MEYRGLGVGVVSAVAILSMVLAGGTIWLLLTNPVTVATAVNEGEITPFARDLANIILQALQGLLKYL